ncbi:DUF6320 domain-containing protein [Brachyspira hampsonii]|uniref:Zinc ribbon domain-containing protein n=2 Tax=Brachyspira hampsonii TaxID=1287055 RepID=A0A2U4EZX5_9SPIR|nr:DUF6320 domain-containing protein [Brachyspira hampsonii]EKV57342.1 hypothetical protein A966_05693 [Brachyspira hampsonii 30446]MBW5390551.1 hypothetical protein [Brachyspira hampsonii]OEJ18532.1 hypothetical protein A9495_05575 [Brachyspira hampsonii]
MSYCNNCRLKIKTNRNICPLCLKELNNNNDNMMINEEYHSYEWFYKMQKKINSKKIVLLSSLTMIIVLIIVNISTNSKYNWAVISIISILCAYFTFICFTANTLYLRQKLIIEFFILIPLVIVVDIFSGFHKWSFNYVIPFLALGLNIAMFLIAIIDRKYFNEYVSYIVSSSFISIMIIILPLFHFVLWSSLSALGGGIIIILAMLILFRIDFISSIIKIFHI